MSFDPMTMLTLARDNKADEISAAIERGVPADICNQMGQTPLHIASLWGNIEAVKALLAGGANPSVQNSRGQCPLHFAASARENSMQVCKILLAAGGSTDSMDAMGRVPYECADSDEVRMLLGGPDSRLFQFCERGDAKSLKELIEGGTIKSVRVVDSEGRTPINLAVVAESLETVQVLLTHDPQCLDLPDAAGDTPLLCAAMTGNEAVLTYVLSLKPNLDSQNINQSEYAAGNWMLRGETIMPLDKTPLHVAMECGEPEAAKLLLEAGANCNIPDFDGRTALHVAVEQQDEELMEAILAAGGDPNAKCPDMVSCLHYVSQRGPISIMKLLLDEGADATFANEDGWTPLHLAARGGKADKVELLVKAPGVNLDAINKQGSTPLHLAAINGHAAVVTALLAAGASKAVANNDGKTPADVAKTPEVKALL